MDTEAMVAFVRQQLDEDERKVAAMEREETRVRTAPIFQGQPLGWLAGVDIFVSSKRWRAEVEAKRRILAECERTLKFEDYGHWIAQQVIQALAQPYAGREGWRAEWKVDAT